MDGASSRLFVGPGRSCCGFAGANKYHFGVTTFDQVDAVLRGLHVLVGEHHSKCGLLRGTGLF